MTDQRCNWGYNGEYYLHYDVRHTSWPDGQYSCLKILIFLSVPTYLWHIPHENSSRNRCCWFELVRRSSRSNKDIKRELAGENEVVRRIRDFEGWVFDLIVLDCMCAHT